MNASLKRFFLFSSLVLIVGALFPWFLLFQGTVFGIHISTRALGDAGGAALLILGVSCLFIPKLSDRLVDFGKNLDTLDSAPQRRIMVGFLVLYLLVVLSHKLRAHSLMATHAYDLGFFSNICWNTAHGRWFFSSELERNFMGAHANWILLPISVFYKLGADARCLLTAQALFVAATIPMLWACTRKITGSFAAGALASLLFVCSPYINQSVANDFHPDLWLLPCLMASLLSWLKNSKWGVVGFGLLAILAKEDVSVVLCGWALLLMWKKEWRWTGALLFGMSLGIFLVQTQLFIPHFLGPEQKSLLFRRYSFLSNGYTAIDPVLFLKAIAFHPEKYLRMAAYVLPMGGLTCLAPSFLVPPIISLLPHLLSQAGTQLDLADIYALPSQPFLFCGAAFGAVRLMGRKTAPSRGVVAGVLIAVAGLGLLNSPRYFRSETKARQSAFQDLKRLIPGDASLLAQQNLFPQFDTRRTIQIFPLGESAPEMKTAYLQNPEFVVCDRIGNALPFDGAFLARAITNWESNAAYKKIFEKENFIVFQRLQQESLQWQLPAPRTN